MGFMQASVLGFSGIRLLPPTQCPCLFLLTAPPKAAKSDEETLETPQKNSNRKGKVKKSKKVQNPVRAMGAPSEGNSSSSLQGESWGWETHHSTVPKTPAAEPHPRGDWELGKEGSFWQVWIWGHHPLSHCRQKRRGPHHPSSRWTTWRSLCCGLHHRE